MRGAHQRLRFILGEIGIIPACAGSTFVIVYPPRFSRDHPRMCGEHLWMQASTGATSGSSPHVRGALWPRVSGRASIGIIPACAGSTRPNLDCPRLWGDHPRMYGEHDNQQPDAYRPVGSSPHVRGAPCCLVRTTPSWGSSPHVRGAPVVHGLLDGLGGIIPACAGSTTPPAQDRHATRDHPRMCGEHIQRVLRRIAEQGSSPHVRGARSRSVGG